MPTSNEVLFAASVQEEVYRLFFYEKVNGVMRFARRERRGRIR